MTESSSTALSATRERLLDAAAQLFYAQGVGVGVEALCRAAGVSKRSMYQLFDSKDEVMAASLERMAPGYWAALAPGDQEQRDPRARILHVFERLEQMAASPPYHGCPFVAAAVEVKRPEHPASLVARKYKDAMTRFFQREAERAAAPQPALLAQQLTIVFDGASARAVVQADALRGVATATAAALLDHAGITEPAASRDPDADGTPDAPAAMPTTAHPVPGEPSGPADPLTR